MCNLLRDTCSIIGIVVTVVGGVLFLLGALQSSIEGGRDRVPGPVYPQPYSTLIPPRALENEYFRQCCSANGLASNCTSMCVYPPPNPTERHQMECVSKNTKAYLNCYTQNKDNTDCCRLGGLTGKFERCLKFCRKVDEGQELKLELEDYVCRDLVGVISGCNKGNLTLKHYRQYW